jgi:hypothetical protein
MKATSPLDITNVIGRAKNRIYRVGIELEGGWSKLPEGTTLVHDGSVQIASPRDQLLGDELIQLQRSIDRADTSAELQRLRARYRIIEQKYRAGQLQTGELPSEPMELEKLPIWLKKYYPQQVNATCGLHIHMSFKSAFHYQRLMIPQYPLTIVEYLFRWAHKEELSQDHPIWPRLKGDSEFCQPVFDPDRQARRIKKEYNRHEPGNRYSMINFCFGTHGTLECRLLPMMDNADQGLRAVQTVIDVTNACLVDKRRETRLVSEVVIDPNDDIIREEKAELLEPYRITTRMG